MKRDYDSTVARMAGNIAAGLVADYYVTGRLDGLVDLPATCVNLARDIINEVRRTEPQEPK